tara:strand:- start:7351 stop:10101 length:2751 start_codon:yes stop_codon:yes gene_type:complete
MKTARTLIPSTWVVVCLVHLSQTHVVAQENPSLGSSQINRSVTVAPFINITAEPSDAWLSIGITEALVIDLRLDTQSDRTGNSWLIRGGYQHVNAHLRITAELVEISTGTIVDAVKLDGKLSDLFTLQDELTAYLAHSLSTIASLSTSLLTETTNRPQRGPTEGQMAPPRPPSSLNAVAASRDRVPTSPSIGGTSPASKVDMTVRAIALPEPLQFDGILDEAVYRDFNPATGFLQQEPDEGMPATDQTELWVLFDADTVYFAVRCWSEHPDQIVANEMQRDGQGVFGNDTISILLDTFYDRRNGFEFKTNAMGGLFDGTIVGERNSNRDWNGVWDVRTAYFDQGWTIEMAIPFKTLRYRAGAAQVWGINVQRRVASKNEISFLTPMPAALSYSAVYAFSLAATLVDLEVPESAGRFEIKPYAISDATTDFRSTNPASTKIGADTGVDIKYGITQGLTADFTYNTDFAQVEVDEQQVNLTRFSLFFPEKREFFLEGQGLFDFGPGRLSGPMASTYWFKGERYGTVTPVLFFSRRIGLNQGQTVPIRGGGRLTGKTGAYSVGLLNVQTGTEARTGTIPTNFSVVRLKRDVLRRSSIGTLFTGRSISIDQNGSNQVYGVDGDFRFYDNLRINSYLARSETSQYRSDDLSYETQLDYSGEKWGMTADHLSVGKNFNPEVGFVRRNDFHRNFASFRVTPRPRSLDMVRRFLWEGSIDYTVDGAGLLVTRIQQGLFATEFENGDRMFIGATDNFEYLKAPFQITPNIAIPVGGYSFLNKRVVYAIANNRPISGGLTFDRGGFFGGSRTSLGYTNGRAVLTSTLSFEPSVSFNWINLPQGKFLTRLVAVRSTYTLSPRMFTAAIVQYNSSAESLSTNIRFRWEYQPGSELFVVYTDERDTLTPRYPVLENRAFVVKVTRLLRF